MRILPLMQDLLEALASHPLLCDGAMGTQLFNAGLAVGECGMLWNAEHPERVRQVHEAYLKAGCRLLTTNTFGGTAYALERHGLAARAAELNRAGARIACEAAGDSAWVLGDIGPFGDFLEPLGETSPDELAAMFGAQIEALAECDAILIETMSDPAEMEVAISAAVQNFSGPVLATYAFQKTGEGEFRTYMGTTVEEAVSRAIAAGANVVGTNCGVDLAPADYLELARQLVCTAGATPVIVQPNAGSPHAFDTKFVYQTTEDEMATLARDLVQAGVRIVGGCCGTTPALLAAMSRSLAA